MLFSAASAVEAQTLARYWIPVAGASLISIWPLRSTTCPRPVRNLCPRTPPSYLDLAPRLLAAPGAPWNGLAACGASLPPTLLVVVSGVPPVLPPPVLCRSLVRRPFHSIIPTLTRFSLSREVCSCCERPQNAGAVGAGPGPALGVSEVNCPDTSCPALPPGCCVRGAGLPSPSCACSGHHRKLR